MAQTLEEIRRKGLNALRKELGRSGMIRFLLQYEIGGGDYARERHAWVDDVSLDQLRALVRPRRTRKP